MTAELHVFVRLVLYLTHSEALIVKTIIQLHRTDLQRSSVSKTWCILINMSHIIAMLNIHP